MELAYSLFLNLARIQSRFVIAGVFKSVAQGTVWSDLEKHDIGVVHRRVSPSPHFWESW